MAEDCKPTLIDLNTEYHTENDENQVIDEDFNANDQQTNHSDQNAAEFDYGNETDSSESFLFMRSKLSLHREAENEQAEQTIGPTECEMCGKSFSNKSNLKFHQRNSHSLKYLYNCKLCDKRFEYKKELVAHRSMDPHLHVQSYECWQCHQT